MCTGHVKHPLFLSDSTVTWNFSIDFRKISKYQISWKFVQWDRNCSMGTDGEADMRKVTVAFRKLSTAPKTINAVSCFAFPTLHQPYCFAFAFLPVLRYCILRHLIKYTVIMKSILPADNRPSFPRTMIDVAWSRPHICLTTRSPINVKFFSWRSLFTTF